MDFLEKKNIIYNFKISFIHTSGGAICWVTKSEFKITFLFWSNSFKDLTKECLKGSLSLYSNMVNPYGNYK